MKLVFLFDSTYPYYTGGIETWMYNVCERLIENHDITILNVERYRQNNPMGEFRNINKNIKFISVKNWNHNKLLRPFVRSYAAFLNSHVTVKRMCRKFEEIDQGEDACFVIALGTVFAAKTARLLKKKHPNLISVVSCRSLHPEVLGESYPGVKGYAMRLEKKNLKAADAIWSNGHDTQEALRKKGYDSIVIKNGVDVGKFENASVFDYSKMGLDDKIKIVTIGTVQKIKGYYEIIEAVKILKTKYNMEVHLIGIGKGNIEKFSGYARTQQVEEQIHFTGEQRDVVQYAKGADLVVCLSGGSGFGMAALESMLSKTPIVAWDSPVYRQMLKSGESGLLVKAWSAEELAAGIRDTLAHPEKNTHWGEAAYSAAKEYDWGNVIKEIECELGRLRRG